MPARGCHLIGSVPFSSPSDVFQKTLAAMPNRLKRIPDGETGSRIYFTMWQQPLLQSQAPLLSASYTDNMEPISRSFTPAQIEAEIQRLEEVGYQTHYDDVALESYAIFKRMKEEGAIPAEVKFQVCLPTPANTISPFVERAFQAAFEPIYTRALYAAMRRIQDAIPHDQLAIQIDLAVDTAFWEGVYWKWWGSGDVKEGVLRYLVSMIEQVDGDVELGLHNCYGDIEHRHYMEPVSLAAVTERLVRLWPLLGRRIGFFHVPVPRSAMGALEGYLEPLREAEGLFERDQTELVLGLVHFGDLEGTRRRIEVADRVLGREFAVATECGWGRTPGEQVEDVMRISKEVSEQVF